MQGPTGRGAGSEPDKDVTEMYLARQVDSRMVEIIEAQLQGSESVIDVACGSGLYGPALHDVVPAVYGIDYDPVLCDAAERTGAYERVVADRVENVGTHFDEVESIFCSEFLEHVPNESLRDTVDALEAIARRRIVITVPNPLSPHFKHDPTHIGKYTIFSMRKLLNQSSRFSYRLFPLGLADTYRLTPWGRWVDVVSSRVALLSPTVLYVGDRR